MSLFFTLSGFLITEQLYTRRNLAAFFVRRLFRIVPLAWIYVSFVALLLTVSPVAVVAHLLFAVNYATASMTPITAHFWSLCVEVHFYLAIATLMAITRFRGFRLLPVAWLGFVVLRACLRPAGTIETHFRVDEILSGSCLALVHLGEFGPRIRALVAQLPFLLLAALLVVASHPNAGVFDAFRSLLAATLVGRTLFATDDSVFIRGLRSRALRYVAEISYALYVIHPLTMWGWLGSGSKFAKYAKRPLSFLLTFGLAHLSTFYFERPILKLGKRLAAQIETGAALRVVTAPSPEP